MSARHPYSHDSQARDVLILIPMSVFCAWAFAAILMHHKWTAPWWLDTPAVLGFYGFLSTLFDRWAWRQWPFRVFHSIPNLNGRYKVTIRSSHDQHGTPHAGTAVVSQTWHSIVVHIETDQSKSESHAAWLVEAPGEGHRLTYVYANSPKSGAPSTLERHDGTAIVTFSPDGSGEGEYYSGRGRMNHGEISFRRRL